MQLSFLSQLFLTMNYLIWPCTWCPTTQGIRMLLSFGLNRCFLTSLTGCFICRRSVASLKNGCLSSILIRAWFISLKQKLYDLTLFRVYFPKCPWPERARIKYYHYREIGIKRCTWEDQEYNVFLLLRVIFEFLM